jgi:leader peptidase (prepilin peptidase)/N-methyltransferase
MILTKENEDLVGFSIFIIGLIFGSFLNVLIYRLSYDISLIKPSRSICINCNHTIKWYHNIPVLSFFYLKGKCSYCSSKISILYPFIELFTAIITLVLYLKLGLTIDFIIIVLLFYILIILSFIDFNIKAVPDYLLLITLIISSFYSNFSIQNALIFAGAFVLLEQFITFYIQNIKYKITKDENLLTQKALGEGDIPIVAIIGGILGIKLGITSIVLAAILAIIPSIYNIIKNKDIETPFIPFLSLGFFIIFIFNIH